MFQPDYVSNITLSERLRAGLGRRSTGLVVALLLEVLLILAIWSLSQSKDVPQFSGELVTTFDASDEAETSDEPEPAKQKDAEPTPQKPAAETAQPVIQPPAQAQPQPAPTTPPFIPIPSKQMQQADISGVTKAKAVIRPGAPMQGPPNTPSSSDSKRVGTAPNGEPLYAASWYRKPYQSELSGFLSTANGPGWGLIACKTAPDYRVEDCVVVDEQPNNSNYGRAVLAASWQFQVRPPRVGGRSQIGAWVRIMIYDRIDKAEPE